MDNKTDITVIVPIHKELNEFELNLLKNGIKSVETQDRKTNGGIMFVIPANSKGLKKQIEDLKITYPNEFVENSGKTDFYNQVNLGVESVKTEWFTVLEFDDEFSLNWFNNFETYKAAYPEVKLFLPIVIDTDDKHQFIGTTNEIAWANSFSEKLGFIDNSALLEHQNISIGGSIINVEEFKVVGKFKDNLEMMNTYEFLLRATFNNAITMVIPRYGYKHMNQREDSLFKKYKETMSQVDANWWLSKAKKEFYFTNQRVVAKEETTN
jgi:hypothetical protein